MKRKIIILSILIFVMTLFFNFNYFKVKANPLLNEIGHKIILKKVDTFNVIEREKLIIRFDTEEKIAHLVINELEDKYNNILDRFNYDYNEKTSIIIYKNGDLLNKHANFKKGNPPMGAYLYKTLIILDPNKWIKKDENFHLEFIQNGPIVHEFTHLIVDKICKGNYPTWFTEGIALYMEYEINGYEWGEKLHPKDQFIYNIDNLTHKFHNLDEYKAYRKSFENIKGFVDEYGLDNLNKIMILLGEGHTFNKAHKKVLNKEVSEIYN